MTTYSYDALNRTISEIPSGSAASPYLTFCYDGQIATGDGQCGNPQQSIPLAHGHLTGTRSDLSSASLVSATSYTAGFDPLGTQQTTGGSSATPYSLTYGYDLAGSVVSEIYPSGRTVTTGYDLAERPTAVTGVLGQTTTQYVQGGIYAPQGAVQAMSLNQGGYMESCGYNSRLQPASITAGSALSIALSYQGPNKQNGADNGNVFSEAMTRAGSTWSQAFGYDGVNRLSTATGD